MLLLGCKAGSIPKSNCSYKPHLPVTLGPFLPALCLPGSSWSILFPIIPSSWLPSSCLPATSLSSLCLPPSAHLLSNPLVSRHLVFLQLVFLHLVSLFLVSLHLFPSISFPSTLSFFRWFPFIMLRQHSQKNIFFCGCPYLNHVMVPKTKTPFFALISSYHIAVPSAETLFWWFPFDGAMNMFFCRYCMQDAFFCWFPKIIVRYYKQKHYFWWFPSIP